MKNSRKWIAILASLGLLLAILVLGGAYFANTASGQGPRAAVTKVSGSEKWPPAKQTMFAESDKLPPAKQTVFARSFPTDAPNAFVAPPGGPTPILPTVPPPPTGFPPNALHHAAGAGEILENGGGSAPLSGDYFIVNEWWATTNSEKIRAFAGGVWDDPLFKDHSQGFVSVTYHSLDYSRYTRPQVIVETPSRTGTLTIVDATGMKLKLQSDQGVIYYFDVNTGKFVSQ